MNLKLAKIFKFIPFAGTKKRHQKKKEKRKINNSNIYQDLRNIEFEIKG